MSDLDIRIDTSGIPTEREASLTAEYGDPTLDEKGYRESLLREIGEADDFQARAAAAVSANRRARALGKPAPHSTAEISDLLRASLAAAPAGDLD
jgi:hypothetical protein